MNIVIFIVCFSSVFYFKEMFSYPGGLFDTGDFVIAICSLFAWYYVNIIF